MVDVVSRLASQRPDQRLTPDAMEKIKAALFGAVDPFGVTSGAVSNVSPEAGQAMRETQAAHPGMALTGGIASGGPIVRGAMAGGNALVNAVGRPALAAALGGYALTSPSEAGDNNAGMPQARDLGPLYEQRAAMTRQLQDATLRRDQNRPRNRAPSAQSDPRWAEADAEVRRIESQLSSVNDQIVNAERMNSPEYRLNMAKAEANQAAELAKEKARTPTSELWPTATTAAQVGLIGAGLASSMAMKGRNLSRFRAEVDNLTEGLAAANKSRTANSDLVKAIAAELQTASPSKVGTVAPAIAGFELGAFAPTIADYYRAGGDPNSPLYQKAINSMTGTKDVMGVPVPDFATRALLASGAGWAASKIGNYGVEAAMGRPALPRTEMLKAQHPAPPAPQGPGGAGGGPGGAPPPATGQGPQQAPVRGTGPNPQGPGGPQPGSPLSGSYTQQHSDIAGRYIDELLASGQPLPPANVMMAELQKRIAAEPAPGVRAQNLSQRTNAMHAAMEAGADPRKLLGRSGFLAVPAAAGGAATMLPDEEYFYQ